MQSFADAEEECHVQGVDETVPQRCPSESTVMQNSGSKPFPFHYWWPADTQRAKKESVDHCAYLQMI